MRCVALNAALALACARQPVGDTSDAESGSDVDPSTTAATSSPTSTDAGTISGAGEHDSSGSTDDGTDSSFVGSPDIVRGMLECDVWSNDCPPGEKCMPYANDGGNAWNATKCSPISPDANDVGEPCTVEGSGVSGVDDCDVSSMCWNVDPDTNTGKCVAFCLGSLTNPECEDPCANCVVNAEGVVNLCFPACDPVAPDCDEGEGCYPALVRFSCFPDASGKHGEPGSPCEFVNGCDPGLFCAPPRSVAGCMAAAGCCAAFCDLDEVDPCPGAAPAVECVPWFQPGAALPACTTQAIGACLLP